MKLYGLIGFPLSHSFSASWFAEKFRREGITGARYDLFPISDISELNNLIENNPDLKGLNVTIPYKKQVLPFLTEIEAGAAEVGAVNTIKIDRKGGKISLKGYNTDTWGFAESLRPLLRKDQEKGKALILGTGGASKAAEWVLVNMGFEVTYVSRKPAKPGHISYQMVTPELIKAATIIVNASPVGMFPHIREYPDIPYQYLSGKHILYDLVYNPEITQFLEKGKQQGATIKNGLQMLHLQAEKSWEIWENVLM